MKTTKTLPTGGLGSRPPAPRKPAAKFKTGKTKSGRTVHTYKDGRRVVLPASKPDKTTPPPTTGPTKGEPLDPYAASVEAATRVKFDPARSALDSAQRAEKAQAPQIDAWYDRYRGAVEQATTQNAAASAQAQATLSGLQNAAATNDRAGQAQIGEQMSKDAAARGAAVDPQVLAQLQQGSQVRASNLAGSQAVLAGQGVQQGAVDRQKGVAGEGTRVASLLENAGRIRELLGKKTALARDEGDFKVSYKQDLIGAEQKSRLEEIALTGKLATDTLKANEPNEYGYTPAQWAKLTPKERQDIQRTVKADVAAATRAPEKPASTTPNQYGYPPKDWAAMTTAQRQAAIKQFKKDGRAPGKGDTPGKPGKPPAAQGKLVTTVTSALSFARQLKGLNVPRAQAAAGLLAGQKASQEPLYESVKNPRTGKVTQRRVLNPDGTQATKPSGRDIPAFNGDPLALSIALDVAYDGHISKDNIRKLLGRGLRPGQIAQAVGTVTAGNYRPPRRVVRGNPDRR